MKRNRILTAFAATTAAILLSASCTQISDDPQVQAAIALARRISPKLARNVEFRIVEPGSDSCRSCRDYYTLATEKDRLVITANCSNSLAMGLGDYLRDWCKVTVTPYVRDEVRLPLRLPSVDEETTRRAILKDRFFLNYCTYGYSLDWYRWPDWERMIDWMALNGVNMALANTGQESVWLKVWQQFGLNEQQIRDYFVGPAFLSWHRMTNIDKWDSPLPYSWLDGQCELQKQIIARERSLGIAPILSCFTGHVPAALKEVYPEADMHRLSDWAGFPTDDFAWYLNPSDPLYRQIQKAFLKEQKAMYGQDCHIYGVDLFNEVDPPAWEAGYLSEAARLTYEAMAETDPDAVWLQMAWLFYHDRRWRDNPGLIEAYISPVPKGRLIMLDYYCDHTEIYRQTSNFYGQDFIWSYLGNFGGRSVIGGNVKDLSMKIDRVLTDAPEECVGVGCTLEGLDVNNETYEYVLSRAWEQNCSDSLWFERLADRHLGHADTHNRKAWDIMFDDVLRYRCDRGSLLTSRPNLEAKAKWSRRNTKYDNTALLEAWGELLSAKPSKNADYRFDCVNFARQCMSNYFTELYIDVLKAYKEGDVERIKTDHGIMTGLLADIDRTVGADAFFLLGKWVEDARSWAADEEEKAYYEHDARCILATWGPKGKVLVDYANREWNGLISTYYAPRWEKFLNSLEAAAPEQNFDEAAFESWSEDFEWNWIDTPLSFQAKPEGDPYAISTEMLAKYGEQIAAFGKE